MAPTGDAYNIDWIVSSSSNVHAANHRDWFTSFTDFSTTLNGGSMKVLGIGDVTLPVKTQPDKTGAAAQGTIVLRDVCYAPSAVCNIIGFNIIDDGYNMEMRCGSGGTITEKKTGARVGILDLVKLMRLRTEGPISEAEQPRQKWHVHDSRRDVGKGADPLAVVQEAIGRKRKACGRHPIHSRGKAMAQGELAR